MPEEVCPTPATDRAIRLPDGVFHWLLECATLDQFRLALLLGTLIEREGEPRPGRGDRTARRWTVRVTRGRLADELRRSHVTVGKLIEELAAAGILVHERQFRGYVFAFREEFCYDENSRPAPLETVKAPVPGALSPGSPQCPEHSAGSQQKVLTDAIIVAQTRCK